MYAHLKNCSQKLKKERSKFLQNLRSIINATQEKLKKYYDATSSKKNLYFNLDLCLNSCDKLDYYRVRIERHFFGYRDTPLRIQGHFSPVRGTFYPFFFLRWRIYSFTYPNQTTRLISHLATSKKLSFPEEKFFFSTFQSHETESIDSIFAFSIICFSVLLCLICAS
jgi:hypothetical protein